MKIRRRIFGAFEMAESAGDPAERARWLTFALVGAGPTGVELAGQIREVATKTLRREYRHIKPEDARVLLFDGGSAPLAMFGPKLSALAARDLGKLGVELHMGSIVTHVDPGGLEVKDHDGTVTRYETRNVLWTAGVEAPPLAGAVATATGAQQDRAGRIVVGTDLHHSRPSGDPGHRGRDEPGQAARGGRGGHADRAVRRAQGRPPGPRSGLRQAVPLPRPGLGRLHLARQSRRLGVQAALRRLRWAGGSGCSSTSASSPATATGSERCSAGGSRSPATCAGNGPSPSTTCRWPRARTASTTRMCSIKHAELRRDPRPRPVWPSAARPARPA